MRQKQMISFLNPAQNSAAVPLCRVGDLKQQHVMPDGDNVVTDSALRAAMPLSGPVHLAYDDVLDISMYSNEEIGDSSDCLEMFAAIEYEYEALLKNNSRRDLAGLWLNRN